MPYRKIQPLKQLRPFVESIWIQEDLRDASIENFRPTIILPSAKIDLLFFYRDPFVQFENEHTTVLPKFFLIGQRTKAIEVAATGQTGIIICSFYPWGAAPFFRLPLYEFKDCSIELSSFMNPISIRALESRILETSKNSERVNILQNFLVQLLKCPVPDSLVMQSTFKINQDKGNVEVNKLSKIFCLSRRQYIRRFKNSVGISPKKFANIVRFQKAIYFQRMGLSWTRIADECGYYDQPHFIKEIKAFSGFSPQELLSRKPPTKLMKYFNPSQSLSHFYNTIYL